MPVNLMDLYKDENESSDESSGSATSGSETSEVVEATLEAENSESGVIQAPVSDEIVESVAQVSEMADASEFVAEPAQEVVPDVTQGLSEDEKKEYGATKMPTKIEVEDLEEQKSDFLKDPMADAVPEDLEYSQVFESKTVVNYTLAIAGFGLLVLGVFSFLNSQNVSIQSSLDVISETGKGSLSVQPPGLPAIDLKSAVGSGSSAGSGSSSAGGSGSAAGSGSASGSGSSNSSGLIASSGNTDPGSSTGSGSSSTGSTGSGSSSAGATGSGSAGSGSTNSTGSGSGSTGSGVSNAGSSASGSAGAVSGSGAGATETGGGSAFGVFGAIDPSLFSGNASGAVSNTNPAVNRDFGSFGSVTSNPSGSDLDALLTDNDFQLDLIADDSKVSQNSFLSSTNPTVIRAGNIAGDSGPEIYLALMISLMFAGFLTIKTT